MGLSSSVSTGLSVSLSLVIIFLFTIAVFVIRFLQSHSYQSRFLDFTLSPLKSHHRLAQSLPPLLTVMLSLCLPSFFPFYGSCACARQKKADSTRTREFGFLIYHQQFLLRINFLKLPRLRLHSTQRNYQLLENGLSPCQRSSSHSHLRPFSPCRLTAQSK